MKPTTTLDLFAPALSERAASSPTHRKAAGAPFARGSDTSRAAAEAVLPEVSAKLRRLIYERLLLAGPRGMTDGEVQASLGMEGNTERPRRLELVESGHVRDSGQRRPTETGRKAVVWVAVHGREA